MSESNYAKFIPEFDLYYLADSDVLAITYSDNRLSLLIDAALAVDHPEYTPPAPNYARCWKRAVIEFSNVSRLCVEELEVWIQDVDDPDGPHLGEMWCIVEEDDHLLLAAEFGHLQIWSDRPTIELVDDSSRAHVTRLAPR